MNEAKEILIELENGVKGKIYHIKCLEGNNILFISLPNPKFTPDNGLNPFLACTFEELAIELHIVPAKNLKC